MTHQRTNILALAAFALTIAGCGKAEEPKAASAPPHSVKANVLTVDSESSSSGYVVTGTVQSVYNSTLSSKVMGRVVAVHVREGDSVKRGQLLVSIDSRELQAAANVAGANYHASVVGVGSAKTAVTIEDETSKARVVQAESAVQQAQAAVAAAEAKRDLVLAGPRTQEVAQSHIAVVQAESTMKFAKVELDRATSLFEAGVLPRRELDVAQNRYDLAKGQYDGAVQSEMIAREGSRTQEVRAAQENVAQAKASLKQAQAGVVQARAAALQVQMRRKEVEVANAQVQQASAMVQSARVSLSYGQVLAPFDGRIVKRLVDPGAMASPGVPLIEVQGGDYRLEATVPERIMKSLRVGTTAPIHIDSLVGGSMEGQVVEIVPQGDPLSHSFVVKFSLGVTPGLKAGMFGKATIRTGTEKGIAIPATATWERDGLQYVYAVNPQGIARLRIVTLGELVGDRVQVLSGLNVGDRIVESPRDGVVDGDQVEGN